MTRGKAVDEKALHKSLWSRADRLGRLTIKSIDLANEIGVTVFTMSRVMGRLEDSGRIRQIASSKTNIKTYWIRNPAEFE